MKILSRYILKQYLANVFLGLAIFTFVVSDDCGRRTLSVPYRGEGYDARRNSPARSRAAMLSSLAVRKPR